MILVPLWLGPVRNMVNVGNLLLVPYNLNGSPKMLDSFYIHLFVKRMYHGLLTALDSSDRAGPRPGARRPRDTWAPRPQQAWHSLHLGLPVWVHQRQGARAGPPRSGPTAHKAPRAPRAGREKESGRHIRGTLRGCSCPCSTRPRAPPGLAPFPPFCSGRAAPLTPE